MVDRATRSSKYQWSILETVFSHDMMSSFSNEDSISSRLNPWEYNEELLELEDQLKKAFWRLVEGLTKRQKEVIKLYAAGFTQMEIGKKLNVNQSSITKSIFGNRSYNLIDIKTNTTLNQSDNKIENKKEVKSFGGSRKKLNKMIEEDAEIINILKRISEIRSEKW